MKLLVLISVFILGCEFKQFSTVPLPPPQIEIGQCYVDSCQMFVDTINCLSSDKDVFQRAVCMDNFYLIEEIYEQKYGKGKNACDEYVNGILAFTGLSGRELDKRNSAMEDVLGSRGCERHRPSGDFEKDLESTLGCVSTILKDMSRTYQCDRLLSSI